MYEKRIFVDLNKTKSVNGESGVVLTRGSFEDLDRLGIELRNELTLEFWMDDGNDEGQFDPLLFDGIVRFDEEKQLWYAVIDPLSYRNVSQEKNKES